LDDLYYGEEEAWPDNEDYYDYDYYDDADDDGDWHDEDACYYAGTGREAHDVDEYDEIYSNYFEARRRMTDLKLARGFYPIVAIAPDSFPSVPSKGKGGKNKATGKGKGGKRKGKGKGSSKAAGRGPKGRGKGQGKRVVSGPVRHRLRMSTLAHRPLPRPRCACGVGSLGIG